MKLPWLKIKKPYYFQNWFLLIKAALLGYELVYIFFGDDMEGNVSEKW